MYKAIATAIALSLGFAATADAQSFRAVNGMTVTPAQGGTYSVNGVTEFGAQDFWCAIGEYGQRRLGLGFTSRISVAVPGGRLGQPVVFSVDPADAGQRSVSLKEVGNNISAGQARDYCRLHTLVNNP